MADLRLRLLMFAGTAACVTIAFGNCSQVKFQYDEQASLQRLNVTVALNTNAFVCSPFGNTAVQEKSAGGSETVCQTEKGVPKK